MFEVPFTDARTLGDNGQLADLTAGVKALPYFAKYNKAVLAEGTDSKGRIVALPKGAYAQALHYNRKLFSQAGLDPNKPPTTWAKIQSARTQISQKTGKPGYVQMAKDDNTAGWILTTVVYALGGRMEKGTGTKAKATLNNPQTVAALNMLQQMRWTDNSMGVELRLRLERHQPGVRRRQRRYVHQRLGRLHEPRSGIEHRPVDLRPGDAAAGEEQERRRPRRRHARGRQAEREAEREGRGPEVDRLLLRAAADHEGAGDPQREDARRQQAAGRRPRAADVQQEAVRPREHLDQALHQRPAQADEAVHDRDLQPDR